MRIADANISSQANANLQKLKSNIYDASQQVISGKRYERASDAPELAYRSLSIEGQIDKYKIDSSKADVADIRLTDIDNKVDSMNTLLSQIQTELMRVDGPTGGTAESQKDIAILIDGDIEQLVSVINREGVYGDTYFSGGEDKAIELQYDADGNMTRAIYVGGSDALYADVGGGLKVKTDTPITELFGGEVVPGVPPETEPTVELTILNDLIALANELKDPSSTEVPEELTTKASDSLDVLNSAMNTLTIESGRNAELIARMTDNYDELIVGLEVQLADIVGIDEIESIAEFSEQQTLYNTYLQLTAQMSNNSLFDAISR